MSRYSRIMEFEHDFNNLDRLPAPLAQDALDTAKVAKDASNAHDTFDTVDVAKDASGLIDENDASFSSFESNPWSSDAGAAKPNESLSSLHSQGTHCKDDPMHLKTQKRQLEEQKRHLLLQEYCFARSQKMTTEDVWQHLYLFAEKHSFKQSNIFSHVVNLYFTADHELDRSFSLKILTWFVLNYGEKGTAKLNNPLPFDNPYIDEVRWALIKETEIQFRSISRIQGTASSLLTNDQTVKLSRVAGYIAKICRGAAVLVQVNVLRLSDIWPLLGNDVFLRHLDEMYRIQLHKQVGMARREKQNGNCKGACHVLLVERFLSYEENNGRVMPIRHPLHVWVLLANFYYGTPKLAIPFFEKYEGLALAFAPLRSPLLSFLKMSFEKGTATFKISVLYFAAKILGPHFGQDIIFFEQACSHLHGYLRKNRDTLTELMVRLILPSISLCENSEAAAFLAWRILSQVDSQMRSQIYAKWLKNANESVPALRAVTTLLKDDIFRLMQRLTFETIDFVGVLLAELVARCPLIAWKHILQYTLERKDMVPVLVKFVVSHCNDFAQDTWLFMVYDILDDEGKMPFGEDGVCFQEWFKSLSSLIGCLFTQSSYLQCSSLVPYLEFLARRLSTSAASVQLFLDLLTSMSGIKPLRGISDEDIKALGGSSFLKRQVLLPVTEATLLTMASRGHKSEEVPSDQNQFAKPFDIWDHTILSSVKSLFKALHQNGLCVKILTTLIAIRVFRDAPLLNNGHFVQTSFFVFTQFLFALNLVSDDTDVDSLGILSDIDLLSEQCSSVSLLAFVALRRKSWRAQIDMHCLDFVKDMAQRFDAHGVDPDLYAFFWSLEAYDLYVPESEYVREAARIESLSKCDHSLPGVDAARMRLLDILKASQATHKAHVAWLVPQLPKLKTTDAFKFLFKGAMTRASISQQDAHYVFCFLSRTLEDPVHLLKNLFNRGSLIYLFYDEEHEMQGRVQLLREIWCDLRSWPLRKACQDLVGGQQSPMNSDVSISPGLKKDMQATCTLFRSGIEIDPFLQHCEKETMSTISAALNSPRVMAVRNALKALLRIAEFVPRSQDLRDRFVNVQLPALARVTGDCEISALVSHVMEIYRDQRVDTGTTGDLCTRGDALS